MNTANIVVTLLIKSNALMHILWNFQQNLRWSSWKIAMELQSTDARWGH